MLHFDKTTKVCIEQNIFPLQCSCVFPSGHHLRPEAPVTSHVFQGLNFLQNQDCQGVDSLNGTEYRSGWMLLSVYLDKSQFFSSNRKCLLIYLLIQHTLVNSLLVLRLQGEDATLSSRGVLLRGGGHVFCITCPLPWSITGSVLRKLWQGPVYWRSDWQLLFLAQKRTENTKLKLDTG